MRFFWKWTCIFRNLNPMHTSTCMNEKREKKMPRQKQSSYFAWVCFHNKRTYFPQTHSANSYFNLFIFATPKTTCAQLKCVYSSWSIKINVAFNSSNNKNNSWNCSQNANRKSYRRKNKKNALKISAKCLSWTIFERNNVKPTTMMMTRNVVQMIWKRKAVTDDCACFLVAIWQQSAINFKQYEKDHIFIWIIFISV